MPTSPVMFNRRAFLRAAGISTASLLTVEKILADPYAPLFLGAEPSVPIRINGRVHSGGKGIKNVAVSDGISVTATKADGTFELTSHTGRPFVFCSLPSGYEISLNPAGTAKFYEPIRPSANNEMNVSWDLLPSKTSDKRHAFLQLADPQTLDKADMLRFQNETIPDVQKLMKEYSSIPLFGVACGDIMFDRLEYFPDYEKGIKQSAVPFFQVLGNHDVDTLALSDEESIKTFMRFFGPAYYSFNRGDIHYVALDDILWHGGGYIGYLGQEQFDWLAADLALVEKGRTVVVFTHIPPYNEFHLRNGDSTPDKSLVMTNRKQLYRLLEGYKAHVIAGHMHESEHLVDGGVPIHITGAVCGAWWTSDICYDGTPNGYAVFEANGEELKWFYKATGKAKEYQMTVHQHGSDPKYPDEILANVWDADDAWKIFWYEDGIKKGEMKKRRAIDPLAATLYSGDTIPKRYSWLHTVFTDHIFFAAASKKAESIMVEAIDRFGRIHNSKLGWRK